MGAGLVRRRAWLHGLRCGHALLPSPAGGAQHGLAQQARGADGAGPLRQVGAPLAANGVAVDAQGRVIVANMGLLKQQPGPLQRISLETHI